MMEIPMLMTEQEARTKWCPKAVASNQQESPVAVNRGDGGRPDRDCLCITTGCMAWRWRSKNAIVFADWHDAAGNLRGEPRERQNFEGDEPRGYCGAFGRPEA
jgi:hypothetical protein